LKLLENWKIALILFAFIFVIVLVILAFYPLDYTDESVSEDCLSFDFSDLINETEPTGKLEEDKFVEEIQESNHNFYRKTENGEFFHRLLKNGKIVRALLRVSGKRLRRSD
jgi:hypothetical protein